MSTSPDRRSRKRLATRQSISNAATLLFLQRGFDQVTIEEIAAAADVARMTVFNHFARKEDMFFDLDEQGRDEMREALRQRDPAVPPIEALRLWGHRLITERRPYLHFSSASQLFIATIESSDSLKARAREIRDEIADALRVALSESVAREASDPAAHLAASMLVATWTVAFRQAHQSFKDTQDKKRAEATFLAFLDKGSQGVMAALSGTPYA